MFNKKLSLTANMLVSSFFIYSEKEYMEKLSKIKDIKEYRKELREFKEECLYKTLRNNVVIDNFDEIDLLFDKFYPKEKLNNCSENTSKFYVDLLSQLAKSFISHRDGNIVLKYWKSEYDEDEYKNCENEEDFIGPYSGINKIAFWNYLNRIFTTDLLVIIYLLDNRMEDERLLEGFSSTIMLADRQLEGILKKGVSETHIHKSAAINFYISWQDLMNLTGKTKINYKDGILNNKMLNNDIDLVTHILAIAIVRLIMAEFLKNRSNGIKNENWNEFIVSQEESSEEKKDTYYCKYDKKIEELCNDIEDGKNIKYEDYEFFRLWEYLLEKFSIISNSHKKPSSYKDDILKLVFKGYGCSNIIFENIFLFKAIKYIKESNDVNFGKLFLNYIRIKNKVLQTKVQANSIKGLDNFIRYFKRSVSRTYELTDHYDEKNYWKILIENQISNKYLEKLELRAGIDEGSIVEIKKNIKDVMASFLEAYQEVLESRREIYGEDCRYPKIAIVFHLKKEIDDLEDEKCWANFENHEYRELYFIENRKMYDKQVQALNEVREMKGVSEYIVGLDAASSENATEPWVFAPVYENARDSKRGDLFYSGVLPIKRIKSLGFTFHVGEDFRHLITGLRRIDEVIEHFKFHAGDRIGHGIALGVDVDKWIRNNRIVILPRIEYMENMLWVWGIYKDGYYNKSFDISYLEQEVMKQAEKIYGNIEGITIYILWKAYKKKFKEFEPNKDFLNINIMDNKNNRIFCKHAKENQAIIWNEEKLTHAAHCKCYLEKMLEPIQVEVAFDKADLFKQVQKIVCNKVSTKAIVVETNPTSNLAIGQIESIFEHYIHNLNNRGLSNNKEQESSLMVTINSDDPSVFNTNISNELAYIFYSLQEKGYDRENILQWIDKVRQYGMDSSFIEDSDLIISEKIEEIQDVIAELKQ